MKIKTIYLVVKTILLLLILSGCSSHLHVDDIEPKKMKIINKILKNPANTNEIWKNSDFYNDSLFNPTGKKLVSDIDIRQYHRYRGNASFDDWELIVNEKAILIDSSNFEIRHRITFKEKNDKGFIYFTFSDYCCHKWYLIGVSWALLSN
jgi:hypothetical protein